MQGLHEVPEDRRDHPFRLKKALYGCIQNAVLWFNELSDALESLGFTKNSYDKCMFNRDNGSSHDTILVYVDDLFITSKDQSALDAVAEALRKRYGGVIVNTGLLHDFLGMSWDFTVPGVVSVRMEGYIKNILAKYKVIK
jgi:Reverse transcriptase (RNA-dependent DNA polymerase)